TRGLGIRMAGKADLADPAVLLVENELERLALKAQVFFGRRGARLHELLGRRSRPRGRFGGGGGSGRLLIIAGIEFLEDDRVKTQHEERKRQRDQGPFFHFSGPSPAKDRSRPPRTDGSARSGPGSSPALWARKN